MVQREARQRSGAGLKHEPEALNCKVLGELGRLGALKPSTHRQAQKCSRQGRERSTAVRWADHQPSTRARRGHDSRGGPTSDCLMCVSPHRPNHPQRGALKAGAGPKRPDTTAAYIHRASVTTAYSAVIPTPEQEGGRLQFPGPPVLLLEGVSYRSAQSGQQGDWTEVQHHKTERLTFGDGCLHARC